MTTIRRDHICFRCKNFIGATSEGVSCKAFEDIPEEIWLSNNHSKEVEGDKGFRFEPKKKNPTAGKK